MINLLNGLLLIVYCTAAFGIHGGELVTGINRQVRNLLCAIPFGLVMWHIGHHPFIGILYFAMAYVGVNMGFDRWPLGIKGLVTFPPLGAAILPFAYSIKTRWTNIFSEYFSGFLYGVALCVIAWVMR